MNSRFYKSATECKSGFTPTTAMAHHGGSVKRTRIPSLEPERTRSDLRIKTEAHRPATATRFAFEAGCSFAASIPSSLAFGTNLRSSISVWVRDQGESTLPVLGNCDLRDRGGGISRLHQRNFYRAGPGWIFATRIRLQ